MIGTIIASLILLFGFIGLGISRFGVLPSYSSYAAKWTEHCPLPTNLHLWSIVTVVAALLLVPAMTSGGEGNYYQFLGFFAPLYLMVAGLTPEYETNPRQKRVHIWGSIICAICALVWIAVVMRYWYVLLVVAAFMLLLAIGFRSLKSSLIFWGEMTLFISTYISVLLPYVQA